MSFPIFCGKFGKGKVDYVFVNDDGHRCIQRRIPFKGTIYEYTNKPSNFKDVNGISVEPVEVESISGYVKEYENVYNHNYCGDINESYQFLAKEYPDKIEYDVKKLPILYIDIEVESGNGFPHPEDATNEVQSIACYTSHDKKTVVFGLKDCSNPNHIKCKDEQELLINFWKLLGVDVCMIVGWNSSGFDIPYLINRSHNIGIEVEKYLPLKQIRSSFNKDTNSSEYVIPGIVLYDYMNLYKKFKLEKLERYSLDYVCQYEMGQGKVAYTVDHNSLQDLYENDYDKFIDYNIKDVMLIVDLDQKMNFINLGLQLAYIAKSNPQDIFSSMKLWDAIIYNNLLSKSIAVPRKQRHDQNGFEGAYVADPVTGMHDWIVSFDYGSLYPNIMISWNMSPQSIVPYDDLPVEVKKLRDSLKATDKRPHSSVEDLINGNIDLSVLKKHELSMSARGDFFDISKQDIVCKVLEDTYHQRVQTKKQSSRMKETTGKDDKTNELDNIVQALKILMNSYYGLCGNRYFRYYNRDVAESVTITGQMLIKNQMKMLDELMENKTEQKCVKYGDTDSVYFSMQPMIEQYGKLQTVEEKIKFINSGITKAISPKIQENDEQIMNRLNVIKQTLFMNREVIATKAIFLEKKKYACYIKDDEGIILDKPKIKVKGFEIVRTSSPQAVRNKLKDALKFMLEGATEDELREYVNEFKKEFMTLSPEDISFPRGCSNIKKYSKKKGGYLKGTPIHVRAAIMYNQKVKEMKLTKKYPLLNDGSKIKFIYLKMPNPIKENIIGVPNINMNFPKELGIEEYFDYELMFEKTFTSPLKTLTDAIGYDISNKKTMELW